jgi:hypothetical protein
MSVDIENQVPESLAVKQIKLAKSTKKTKPISQVKPTKIIKQNKNHSTSVTPTNYHMKVILKYQT